MGRVPSVSALGIAITLELAITCWMIGWQRTALWVAAFAVSALVWLWTHKRSKVLLVLLNALVLSLPAVRSWGSGSGSGDSANLMTEPEAEREKGGGAAIVADNTFPGVLLFPETKQHATLVPPLPSMRRDVFGPSQHDPLTIPFFGSYWLYKSPEKTLPKNAKVIRGDPDEKTFRATDLRRMMMEAHQNLGIFIETSCCRAIELQVRNADRYPSTVSMELILVNTALPGRPALKLGAQQIQSAGPWHAGKHETMLETLTFELPPNASLPRFDEFTIRYNLGAVRASRSAAIAIDRFRLLPWR